VCVQCAQRCGAVWCWGARAVGAVRLYRALPGRTLSVVRGAEWKIQPSLGTGSQSHCACPSKTCHTEVSPVQLSCSTESLNGVA